LDVRDVGDPQPVGTGGGELPVHELQRRPGRLIADHLAAPARGIRSGRAGTVTVIQRAGGSLNVNPQFHALLLDGVFRQVAGRLEFHSAPGPSDAEVAESLTLIRDRIHRQLQRVMRRTRNKEIVEKTS